MRDFTRKTIYSPVQLGGLKGASTSGGNSIISDFGESKNITTSH